MPLESATYRLSGKVNWARYLPALVIPIGAGLAMAAVLCWAFAHDWYYSLILPVVAALIAGISARGAVVLGHCRNRIVAGLFGALAGAILYLGYFHFHFVSLVGWSGIGRVDMLPGFVRFRMQTDAAVDRNGQMRPPLPARNWSYFGIELVLAVTIVAALSVSRAGRAYCEPCRRWMRRLLMTAAPGSGPPLADALIQDRLESLTSIDAVMPKVRQPSTLIELEYCRRHANSPSPCLAYISVREVNRDAARGREKAKTLLKQHGIDGKVFRALADKIPRLRSIAVGGLSPEKVQLADRSPASAASGERGSPGPAQAGPESLQKARKVSGSVWPVGDDSVAKAFSTKMETLQMLLSLTPIFLALLGAGLLYAGWVEWTRHAQGDQAALILSALLIAFGLLTAGTGGMISWTNVDFLNHWYTFRLTRNFIYARPDALVDPDDPGVEYVTVVPRKNWIKLSPSSNPSDRGFVRIDRQKRQVLFEGLRERYCIPAGAVISCEVEDMVAVGSSLLVTVVRAEIAKTSVDTADPQPDQGEWEAPFFPRPRKFGKYRAAQRRELAESLRQQICQLMA
jgi:hypothetical protein